MMSVSFNSFLIDFYSCSQYLSTYRGLGLLLSIKLWLLLLVSEWIRLGGLAEGISHGAWLRGLLLHRLLLLLVASRCLVLQLRVIIFVHFF